MNILKKFRFESGAARASAPFRLFAFLALLVGPAAAFAQTFNCSLLVPPDPLTATGLTTPYVLSPTTTSDSCDETSGTSAAFVQAVIYDSSKALCGDALCIYNPLIVNASDPVAAVKPVTLPHAIPATATVALWFGSDGGNLTLTDASHGATLAAANCVPNVAENIAPTTLGQFGYCNAVNFFKAVNADIAASNLTVPPIGMGKDGQPCPTVRSFGVVDQDQSDNQTTWYLIVPATATTKARMAQYNATNAHIPGAMTQQNPSDEWLASQHMDTALGCTPWMIPDMTNGNTRWASMATNELQAAAYQKHPIALVPLGDPFTTDPPQSMNGDLNNVNLYRAGVDQHAAASKAEASTTPYCTYLTTIGVQKLQLDQVIFEGAASPVPSVANTLFTFLAQRLVASYGLLGCQTLINQPDPITLTTNSEGVVINATFNPKSFPPNPAPCFGSPYYLTVTGDLKVSAGDTCIIQYGLVTGTVRQDGGTLKLIGSDVDGDVQVSGSGLVTVGPRANISGNLTVLNTTGLSAVPDISVASLTDQVCGSTVQGDLEFEYNAIAGSIGAISSIAPPASAAAAATCSGNRIGGNLTIGFNKADTVEDGNTVFGNMTVESNTAPTKVFTNTVGNDLVCQLNTSITGGGNKAKSKEGQCATF